MAGAGYHLFVAGQVLTAAQVNTYLMEQGVPQFATAAARDSALSSVLDEMLLASMADTNTLGVYSGSAWSTIGPVHGALTSWTPAVVQSGSVTVTVIQATYQRVGRGVSWQALMSVTGSGTASNAVTMSTPGGFSFASTNPNLIVGQGYLYDNSASLMYSAHCVPGSATTMKFSSFTVGSGFAISQLGTAGFTAGLASNDVLSFSGWFEVAADA